MFSVRFNSLLLLLLNYMDKKNGGKKNVIDFIKTLLIENNYERANPLQ